MKKEAIILNNLTTMKLDHINNKHIEKAAKLIDEEGIPNYNIKNQYWVLVNNKEYPFKHLVRIAHQVSTNSKEILNDFQSNENYRSYIESLGFKYNFYKSWINFFSEDEFEYFNSVAGNKFESESKEAVILKKKLSPILLKIEWWVSQIVPEGFVTNFKKRWQFSGTVDDYFWCRIYKQEWQNRSIYFTVGVSASDQSIFYKLDCQFKWTKSINNLDALQQKKFNDYLKLYDCKYKSIKSEKLQNYNWDSFIAETKKYIEDYLFLYDEAVKHVWSISDDSISNDENQLEEKEVPKTIINWANSNSKSESNADYEKINKERKRVGDLGEELVLEFEKNKVAKMNIGDPKKYVYKVPDSYGYDIHSIDENLNEIFIEVKTTPLDNSTPFYITKNELKTSHDKSDKYKLYRLYNFDIINKTAFFFILKGDINNKIKLDPINFIAYK